MTRAAQHPVAYPLWVTVRVLILGCVLGCDPTQGQCPTPR